MHSGLFIRETFFPKEHFLNKYNDWLECYFHAMDKSLSSTQLSFLREFFTLDSLLANKVTHPNVVMKKILEKHPQIKEKLEKAATELTIAKAVDTYLSQDTHSPVERCYLQSLYYKRQLDYVQSQLDTISSQPAKTESNVKLSKS